MKQVETIKSYVKNDEKGSDLFQILSIFSASLAAFTCGMLFSWSSPSIPRIVADKVNYDITLDEASYFTVIPPLGAILSCLVFAKLMDVIGRKYTMLLVAIPHVCSMVLIAVAKSVYVFYIARFLAGIGDGCVFVTLPVYVGEVATPKIRGTWGNFMTFFIYLGQTTINIIGSYTSISQAACICLITPILFVASIIFMPESPYYFLMKNRMDDARASLRKLRGLENVEEELEKLKSDVDRQMSESGTWKDVFTIKSNRRAVYAGIFLRASQQLGGIAVFAVYAQYIFLKSGSDVPASISAIIFMGLCAVLNLCASFTLDKIGRRKSYFCSCLFCGIVLFCEAAYFFLEQFYPEVNVRTANWIPLVGLIMFVVFYSFGLGIVPTLMLGELFSTSIKGKGLVVLNFIFAILVSSVTKLFHVLDTNFGLYSPFLFFSISCLVSTILVLYFVPETKGKTLEEIQQSLKGADKKKDQP